jgi:hypothetical protein
MHSSNRLANTAFESYLRHGLIHPEAPTTLDLKQARTTTHYVWRTRRDGRVRPSHAQNDGKVFAWDNPPPTGHPGEAPGCRCTAEPYTPEVAEYFSLVFSGVYETGPAWSTQDYVEHYLFGDGTPKTLRETGNLSKVVAAYGRIVIDDPMRLRGQIADMARRYPGGRFNDTFGNTYDMRAVVYSLGKTTIRGVYEGHSEVDGSALHLIGSVRFELSDAFRDPLDIGVVLPEPVALLDEVILAAIAEVLRTAGDRVADAAEFADTVLERIEREIGKVDQSLRDYIYERVRRDVMRRNTAWSPQLSMKDLREVPGSTIYPITDKWGGTFTATVHRQRNNSVFRKQGVSLRPNDP